MNLKLVGCSHHDTPIEIRERLSFNDEQADRFLRRFYSVFPKSEAVLLSTCNRTELYAACTENELTPSATELKSFLTATC